MGVYTFKQQQIIAATEQQVWDFISSPYNLKKITPPYMGFDIINDSLPDKIYAGMIIHYTVKPLLGVPIKWVTEITHIENNKYFVDEQRVGPYQLWHHQHFIEKVSEGVLMSDIIDYQPPYGVLGTIANSLFIKRKLEHIFVYRKMKIEEIFKK